MSAQDGMEVLGTYPDDATAGDAIDVLIDLIPDPDSTSSSGAVQGGLGFLDEMSPAAAAQLRVELAALKAAVGTFDPAA